MHGGVRLGRGQAHGPHVQVVDGGADGQSDGIDISRADSKCDHGIAYLGSFVTLSMPNYILLARVSCPITHWQYDVLTWCLQFLAR